MKRWLLPFLLAAFLLPCLAQEQPFFFIMLTDPQFGMYSGDKGFEQESANYEFAVAAVNRLKPAFAIVLGDLINKPGDAAQMAEYRRISGKVDRSIPVYHVAGNHDVGNEPTPESLAAYRNSLGRDYYSFHAGSIHAIVLDSPLIYAPKGALKEYEAQDAWLKKELAGAKAAGTRHIVIFQHHPYFIKEASEPDQYANIPLVRRRALLELFRNHGVRYVFAGHHHQNGIATDGEIQMVISGPVGKPLGADGSGIRIAMVRDAVIEHRYFDFGFLPDRLAVWGK